MIYQCRRRGHQTMLVAGTLFQRTKLPLTKWFLALHLLTSTKTNLAALEPMRHSGVCYRTTWRLKHKVLQAMLGRAEPCHLEGFVQIDDAYLGGERNGGKTGRGAPGKQPFVAAVTTDENLEHLRYAVLEPVRTFDNISIRDWAVRRLAPDAEVYRDGIRAFRQFIDTGHAHTVLVTAGGRAANEVRGARRVNIVLGNAKRIMDGIYHSIRQSHYARRYLAEAQYLQPSVSTRGDAVTVLAGHSGM